MSLFMKPFRLLAGIVPGISPNAGLQENREWLAGVKPGVGATAASRGSQGLNRRLFQRPVSADQFATLVFLPRNPA